MVRIEKLEMQGFKSFSKKTQVLMPSNFSAICGPNGSGKSNVLDAICFVLGRTSAKSLRADRMHEMIFNGGNNKKPSEFAKVSLYFDNSNRTFPVDDDTMNVSRKVNRKGISIYKVNGRTVTRESILEILRSAHIHPDGHNIILQGDITEIIEMSPLQRRQIIDEVSGISEFDQKREKAQKELQTVEERLKESAIILNERQETLKKLERERVSAKKYRDYTKDLDKLRASLATKKLNEAEGAMNKLDDQIKKYVSKEIDKEIEDVDKELDKLQKDEKKISNKLFDRTKDIQLIKEVENIKSEISKKKTKIETNEFEIARLNDLIRRLELMKVDSGSRAVKEIIRMGRSGIYGTIANLSKVDKGYQTAIEVTAASHLHDIIVSDKNVAVECVNHLKKNRVGRATFLPLDKIKERNPSAAKKLLGKKGVIDLAINLVEFDKKYWHAFSHVFGDTVIVDNIENAKKYINQARLVTLDGDLIERSGAIVGGFYRKREKSVFGEDTKKYKDQIQSLKKEILDLEVGIGVLEKKLKESVKKEEKGVSELTKAQQDRIKTEEKIEKLRNKRKILYDRKVSSEEAINRLRIKKARLEAELDNVKAEFDNYKNMEIYDSPIEDLEQRIRKTISSINLLGAINMKALEEYEDLKKRYDVLKEKVDKLSEERDKVFLMITQIEGRRTETFMRTMEAIASQFKVVFNDLVGGEAEIKLEDPDNIESGLLIKASPPGRRVLNIDAMSGGEKTLTALAFLFAIQKFRPAPFYILDEIDAALDKPNTKKITEFLKKYSGNAQFIVISHNDVTIQAADCVYGVTMEDGESRIIGIKMPQ